MEKQVAWLFYQSNHFYYKASNYKNNSLLENLGYKVFRVPETATILLSGGVIFSDLIPESSYSFQKSILTVMLSIENTYFELARIAAEKQGKKVIVICDRGAMDPSA